MKTRTLALISSCCCLAALPLTAQTNPVAIFPEEDPQTPENFLLVWPATAGVRYEVRQSTNLQTWATPARGHVSRSSSSTPKGRTVGAPA